MVRVLGIPNGCRLVLLQKQVLVGERGHLNDVRYCRDQGTISK